MTTRDIDRRVDVFAVGCMLYEATVGERPFHGGDALSTLYQLLEQPIVPPSARAENYSPELEAIVLKAMARDRDERYPSAAEFGRALERWLKRLGVEIEYYDPHAGAGISALMKPNTKVVFTESPGSNTFEMQDIPAIARAATTEIAAANSRRRRIEPPLTRPALG